MSFLIFGAILASICFQSWVPILLLVGVPTFAFLAASGPSALNVRLV